MTKESKQKHTIRHYILTVFSSILTRFISMCMWVMIFLAGYSVYVPRITPFDLVIGIPLMLIGLGLFINSVGSIAASIFSPKFNQANCMLCGEVENELIGY